MNIPNIHSTGGIDRGTERTVQIPRPTRSESPTRPSDSASISDDSRQHLDSVERLTEKLKQEDPSRQERIEAARTKLANGGFDAADVFRATAEDVLRSI